MQKIPRLFKTLAILIAFSAVNANAEVWVGNGGNINALHFVQTARNMISDITSRLENDKALSEEAKQRLPWVRDVLTKATGEAALFFSDGAYYYQGERNNNSNLKDFDIAYFNATLKLIVVDNQQWNQLSKKEKALYVINKYFNALGYQIDNQDGINTWFNAKLEYLYSNKDMDAQLLNLNQHIDMAKTCPSLYQALAPKQLNRNAAEFYEIGCQIYGQIKKNNSADKPIISMKNTKRRINDSTVLSAFDVTVKTDDILTALLNTEVTFVEWAIEAEINTTTPGLTEIVISDAVNLISNQAQSSQVVINKPRWDEMSVTEKYWIVLHELLGVNDAEVNNYFKTLDLFEKFVIHD